MDDGQKENDAHNTIATIGEIPVRNDMCNTPLLKKPSLCIYYSSYFVVKKSIVVRAAAIHTSAAEKKIF